MLSHPGFRVVARVMQQEQIKCRVVLKFLYWEGKWDALTLGHVIARCVLMELELRWEHPDVQVQTAAILPLYHQKKITMQVHKCDIKVEELILIQHKS